MNALAGCGKCNKLEDVLLLFLNHQDNCQDGEMIVRSMTLGSTGGWLHRKGQSRTSVDASLECVNFVLGVVHSITELDNALDCHPQW